jgi:hypothetical protein
MIFIASAINSYVSGSVTALVLVLFRFAFLAGFFSAGGLLVCDATGS